MAYSRSMTLTSVLLGALIAGQAMTLPSFSDYPALSYFHGSPAKPILKTSHQRMFKTRIREAMQNGANFAGRYTIAYWGCGTDCTDYAIIDAETGETWDLPFRYVLRNDFRPPDYYGKGVLFRKDSRLLVVDGCPDGDNCASYFYEWQQGRVVLLKKAWRLKPSN